MRRTACALALGLVLAALPATASMPPIPLPAWVKVDLTLDRAPEIGSTATGRLTLTALLDRLEGVRWELDLPDQLDLSRGARKGTADLEKGKPAVVEVSLRARGPIEGANVAVEVTTRPPRAALADEVARTWKDQREVGMKLIAALPKEDVQRRIVGLTVTADEGLLAEARDPAYRRVVRVRGSVFALLDALPGVDAKGVERQLKAQLPRLERFRRISSGKPDDPLTRLVNDLTLENAKLRMQRVVLALAEGRHAGARAELSAADVARAGLPPSLEHGRRMAMAVAAAMTNDPEAASRELDALSAVVPPGQARRYIELNRAEVHRLASRLPEAREAYQRALAVAPAFTLVRKRLLELK